MARYFPSGAKASGVTQGVPMSISARRRPVSTSHTLATGTFQSRAPVINVVPSGENAMDEPPSSVAISSHRATSQTFTRARPGLALKARSNSSRSIVIFPVSTFIGSRSELSRKARVLPSPDSAKSLEYTLMLSERWGKVACTAPLATTQTLRSKTATGLCRSERIFAKRRRPSGENAAPWSW